MDHTRFDRIARLFGATISRRAGIGAALGAVIGSDALDADAKRRRRKPKTEGPCGDGKRKANICTKNSECCTGICNTKVGKKNLDRKGRCRCIRRGGKCKADKNCCNQMNCTGGVCSGGPLPVPTGQPCTEADTCAESAASCSTYFSGDPEGTFCLIPNGGACAATTDCRSQDCTGNVCAAETCTVCETGCEYNNVDDAVTSAQNGAVVKIDAGEWPTTVNCGTTESITVRPCNQAAVTLNGTGGTTIYIDVAADKTLTLRDLTVTNSAQSSDGHGVLVQGYAGTTTGLVLRNVTVQDCGGHGLWLTEATSLDMAGSLITGNSGVDSANGNKGAGIFVLGTQANPSSMTISTSSITSNISPYRAGGIYAEQTTVSITDSAVDENTASNDGGGAYFQECPSVTLTRTTFNRNTGLDAGGCTLRDVLTSTITDCHFDENSGEDGGGLRLFSNIAAMTSSILGATTIDRNTASNDSGGLELDSFNSLTVTIGGTTSISNNTVPGQGDPRGGLNLQGDGGINCTLQDDVVISGNSAQGSAGGINVTSGGAANTLTIKDRVRVTGNTSVTGFGGGILMNCSQVTSTLTFVGGDMQITGNTAPNAAGIAAVGSCNVDGVTNAVVTGNNTVDCATSPDFNTWTTVACDQL